MSKQHRTEAELVRIYQLTKEGKSRHEVAAELGIAPEQVGSSWSLLTKYLRGKSKDQLHKSHVYTEAVKQIRSLQRAQKRSITPAPHNGYDFLQKSFGRFQDDIATFIEVEVNTRVQATTTENAHLKEEVETLKTQVAELTERLEATPRNDLMSSLKSKLTEAEPEPNERFKQIEIDL